jgi:hypothetical protein
MPWKCPACATPIAHRPIEAGPLPGTRYRCHVCRLELVIGEKNGELTLPPFEPPSADTSGKQH